VPLRADAQRNRDRIVAAAKMWFATHGPEAPVEEIARTAGVGPGTLYRRFPDRPALIHAVALDNLGNALAEARTAVAEEPTAWGALVRFLRQSSELRLSVQLAMAYPLARTIMKKDPTTDRLHRAMIEVLDGVVIAAQTEGSLRRDIGTGDVAVMFVLLARPVPVPFEGIAELAAERCMAVMLDGLRARSDAHLPGRPLTRSDLGA